MPYSVESVPFLNAKPLVWAFERLGDRSPVKVGYEQPARLPALLDSGQTDAIFVSLIDALTTTGRALSGQCSLSSFGRVMSVRLISRRPFDEIRTLALDATSLTSNTLAQLVLKRMFDCQPTCTRESPDGAAMLERHDACVLIGDNGLTFDASGLHELDLGEAWYGLTGLPFVWACWVGRADLDPRLAGYLQAAKDLGEDNTEAILESADGRVPPALAREYLTTVFDHGLGDWHLESLHRFGEWLLADGLASSVHFPTIVEPDPRAREELAGLLAAANA